MQRVTSRQNPRLREAIGLIASARDRRKAGKCVLEGEHLVAVYSQRHGAPETVIVSDDALARPAVTGARRGSRRPHARRHDEVPVRADGAACGRRRARGRLHAAPGDDGARRILLAPGRRTGSRQRRLDAALGRCGRRRTGVSVEALRVRVVAEGAARGAGRAFLPRHSRGRRPSRVGRRLSRGGGEVVATVASGGASLYDARLVGRVALAVGNEGAGLDPALVAQATQQVTIPMPGGMESLNAAAAAAVCLFECVRQRRARSP